MLRKFTDGTIEYFVDHVRHLVFARWEGDVRGDDLLATTPALWRTSPEIGRWAAIHDMLDFTGILEHRHSRELMLLRVELVPDFDPNVRTAIVSADPMKRFEIKVTNATAPNRQFQLFASNAEALEWMSADEPGNPCAGLGRDAGPVPWWFDRKTAANAVRAR